MIIYPAIDIYDKKIVRLLKGKEEDITSYDFSPRELLEDLEKSQLSWGHMVDLSGTLSGKSHQLQFIKDLIKNTKMKIQFGGGLRDRESIEEMLSLGSDRVIISSFIWSNQKELRSIINKFGKDRIVFALDVKKDQENYFLSVGGWKTDLNKTILQGVRELIQKDLGPKYCLVTDISKDGTQKGPNFDLYTSLKSTFPNIEFMASGGIRSKADLKKLSSLGFNHAIVGKAFYENRKEFL